MSKNKYKSYFSVYLSHKINEIEILKFPKNTVFFLKEDYYKDYIDNFPDYYFVSNKDGFSFNFKDKFYVIVSLKLKKTFKEYIIYFIELICFVHFFLLLFIAFIIFFLH